MNKTKIAIRSVYLIHLIAVVLIILIKIFTNIEIKPLEFSVTYLFGTVICAAVANKVFMSELKVYSQSIYDALYVKDGYVNGFLWLSYALDPRYYDSPKDKDVKLCLRAMLIWPVLAFVVIVAFNLFNV